MENYDCLFHDGIWHIKKPSNRVTILNVNVLYEQRIAKINECKLSINLITIWKSVLRPTKFSSLGSTISEFSTGRFNNHQEYHFEFIVATIHQYLNVHFYWHVQSHSENHIAYQWIKELSKKT